MKSRLFKFLTAALLGTLMALSACGGDGFTADVEIWYPEDEGRIDTIPPEDVVEETTRDEGGTPDIPEKHLYEIILLHDLAAPLDVRVNTSFPIIAKVIDYGMNQPAGDLMVHAEITNINDAVNGNPANGDAFIENPNLLTNSTDGIARIGFNAGTLEGVIYEVTVSIPEFPDVASKTILMRVFDIPCGCLRTSMSYDGTIEMLRDIEVYILPEQYRCNSLSATREVPEAAIIASRTASSMYSGITFDCLPGEKRYTIFTKAGGTNSTCVAATGCYEGMYISPNVCQDLELDLYSTVLNPAGAYDSIDHFDFRNMVKQCAGGETSIMTCVAGGTDIGKTVCCALQEMIKFFETPGTTIMEGIRDIVKLWVGAIIVDTVYNLIGNIIADWITGWLRNSSPDWLQDFFDIGEDMMGTITNLELVSDLLIKKLNNDQTVQGTHYWYGMHLYWKFGCDPDAPDYDQCGLIDLNLAEYIDDPAFPLNFLEGKFTAAISDFDKMYLNQHEIKLNYGKLVLYVINEVVIAGLTKNSPEGPAHSMLELVFRWIDCAGFAAGTLGDILEAIGIGSQQDLEQACRTTLTGLFGFVEAFLNALALDTTLSLTGSARMMDKDCDLMVDQIINGVYTGYIQGDTSQALVTGDFEATRK
ncbi:MAG TPA: hypothetical protein PLB35_00815 [Myxococcota bacterium]|nr:hypothetical protein [Myxococcota bacterium]HOA12470.1 hypothetical protein [Myxococcota bacterium]HOH75775.1 hypothetical protein [Myxococcota bacterium]HPV03279.1 hypothetical protein [Myxococcota bacterium]